MKSQKVLLIQISCQLENWGTQKALNSGPEQDGRANVSQPVIVAAQLRSLQKKILVWRKDTPRLRMKLKLSF